MPRSEDLPDSLKKLARRQGIEVSHTHFDSDVKKLTRTLSLMLEELRQREEAAALRVAEAEAARQAEEERRAREWAEAERPVAREERERQEAAEAARADEARQKADAEAARRAEEERRARESAEAERTTREERERQEAAEAARAEEARQKADVEAAPRAEEEEGRAREVAEPERAACEKRQRQEAGDVADDGPDPVPAEIREQNGLTTRLLRSILAGRRKSIVGLICIAVAATGWVTWRIAMSGSSPSATVRGLNDYQLGEMYREQGRYDDAMNSFKAAADRGDSQAYYEIGWLYEKGLGVSTNFSQARSWYSKAVAASPSNSTYANTLQRVN